MKANFATLQIVEFRKTGFAIAALLTIFTIFGGFSAHAGDAPREERAEDNIGNTRRETQISTVFALSPLLRDSVLMVRVNGANVSLVGKVGSAVERDFAEQIALSVDGIRHVDNLIVLTDAIPSRAPMGDASFRQKIDDASTTAAIRSKLLWSATTSALDIKVATLDGRVRLDGNVSDQAQSETIERIAADTRGTIAVKNAIVVLAVTSPAHGTKAGHRAEGDARRRPVSDTWITARIKATFWLSPSVGGADIAVSTAEGGVSLDGSVSTPAARASAISLAAATLGVSSVDSDRLVTR